MLRTRIVAKSNSIAGTHYLPKRLQCIALVVLIRYTMEDAGPEALESGSSRIHCESASRQRFLLRLG